MTERPVGPFRDHERMLWDMANPQPEDVLQQLAKLAALGSEPLVSALDGPRVAAIALAAAEVIRRLQSANGS